MWIYRFQFQKMERLLAAMANLKAVSSCSVITLEKKLYILEIAFLLVCRRYIYLLSLYKFLFPRHFCYINIKRWDCNIVQWYLQVKQGQGQAL